jgi:hypothetical protein
MTPPDRSKRGEEREEELKQGERPNLERKTQAEGSPTFGEKDVKVGHTPGQAEGDVDDVEPEEEA